MDSTLISQPERFPLLSNLKNNASRIAGALAIGAGSFMLGLGETARAEIQPGEAIDQSCETPHRDGNRRGIQQVAQSFTAGATPLTGVEILYDNSIAPGTGQEEIVRPAELRQGGPKGTVLATSELRVNDDVTRSWERINFGSVAVEEGQQYTVRVFWPEDPNTGSGDIPAWMFCDNDYQGGEAYARIKPQPGNPDPNYFPAGEPDFAFRTVTQAEEPPTTTTTVPGSTSTSTSSTSTTTPASTTTTAPTTTTSSTSSTTTSSTTSTTSSTTTTSTTTTTTPPPPTTTTSTSGAASTTTPTTRTEVAATTETLPRTGVNTEKQAKTATGLVLIGAGLLALAKSRFSNRQPS